MPGSKRHSRATKLAVTFLAKLTSADVAAATFRVDPRTVASWQAGAVDLPTDDWEAIEAVLLARGGEQAARGETRGLVQTLTGAGIAARNRRYATLIARREAQRQPDPEPAPVSPIGVAIDRLDEDRQALLRDAIDLLIQRRQLTGEPEPEPMDPAAEEAVFLEWLDSLAAMSDEDVQTQRNAQIEELVGLHREWKEKNPPPTPTLPQPAEKPTAPPRPAAEPIDLSEHRARIQDDHDHPSWRPYERRRQ